MITIRFNSSNLFEPKIYDESNNLIPFFKEIKKECMIIWVKTYKIRFPINLSPIKQLMLYFRYRVNVKEQNVSTIIKQKICKHLDIIYNVRGTNKNINDKINRRQNLGPRYNSVPGYESNHHKYLNRIIIKGDYVLPTNNINIFKQNSDKTPLLLHVHIEEQDYLQLIYNILETKKEIKRLKISYENEPNESVKQKISILQKKKRTLLTEQHYFNYLNFSDKKNAEKFYKKMGLKKLTDGEGPNQKDWDDLYDEMLEDDKKKAKEYKKKMGESKLRTQVCISVLKGTKCPHGKKCKYAHTIKELIVIKCRKSYKHDHKTCKYKHKDESWGQFYCKPVIGLAKDPNEINKMIEEEEKINPYITFKTSKKQSKHDQPSKKQKNPELLYDEIDKQNIKMICSQTIGENFGRHQISRLISNKVIEILMKKNDKKNKISYRDVVRTSQHEKNKISYKDIIFSIYDILIDRLPLSPEELYQKSLEISIKIQYYINRKRNKTKDTFILQDKIYNSIIKNFDTQTDYTYLSTKAQNIIRQKIKQIAREASDILLKINYRLKQNKKKSYTDVLKTTLEKEKKDKIIKEEKERVSRKKKKSDLHNIPIIIPKKIKKNEETKKKKEIAIQIVDADGFRTPKSHIKRKKKKMRREMRENLSEESNLDSL